jgi:hypothetical protein
MLKLPLDPSGVTLGGVNAQLLGPLVFAIVIAAPVEFA